MQFGYFDNENREYVITNPKTPAPWANYLGSPEYGALISNFFICLYLLFPYYFRLFVNAFKHTLHFSLVSARCHISPYKLM